MPTCVEFAARDVVQHKPPPVQVAELEGVAVGCQQRILHPGREEVEGEEPARHRANLLLKPLVDVLEGAHRRDSGGIKLNPQPAPEQRTELCTAGLACTVWPLQVKCGLTCGKAAI
jgi:hypothetical protein